MTVMSGPVRLASSLIWLPVILLAAYFGDPPVSHVGPSVVAAILGGLAWIVISVRPTEPRWLQPTAIVVLAVAGIGFIAAAGS